MCEVFIEGIKEDDEIEKNITYREENEKLKEKIEELKAEVNQCRYEKEEREKGNNCEVVDSRYNLELGQTPKLIFISKTGLGKDSTLLIDGKEVKGIIGIKISTSIDDMVELSIDYCAPVMENN